MPPDRTLPAVVVRPATYADLPAMARWHCRHLPHGLFPLLGERFVRHWHATFIGSAHGIALVAEWLGAPDPVPVGFLVGSTDQVRHVEDVIRRHRLRLGLLGLFALLGRPRLWRHFLRTRSRAYTKRLLRRPSPLAGSHSPGVLPVEKAAADPDQKPHIAVVTAIVVDPAARGSGAGKALVRSFTMQATVAGAPEAQLATMSGTAGTGQFYGNLGWHRIDEHRTRDGAVMCTYRYRFPGRAPGRTQLARSSSGERRRHHGVL